LLSIADCEICRCLGERQSSYKKYGRPEQDASLDSSAGRLEVLPGGGIRRCPICGTCYRYEFSYEYYVDGAEDSEDLTRLTPIEARPYLSAGFYDELTAQLPQWLQHPALMVRYYAAQSLTALYLAENQPAALAELLEHSQHTDPELALAILQFLQQQEKLPLLPGLAETLAQCKRSTDRRLAYLAGDVLQRVGDHHVFKRANAR
jgi:hypothetical protein